MTEIRAETVHWRQLVRRAIDKYWWLLLVATLVIHPACGPGGGNLDPLSAKEAANKINLTISLSTNQIWVYSTNLDDVFISQGQFPTVTPSYNIAAYTNRTFVLKSISPNPVYQFTPDSPGPFPAGLVTPGRVVAFLYLVEDSTNSPAELELTAHAEFEIHVVDITGSNTLAAATNSASGYSNLFSFGGATGVEAPSCLIEGSDGFLYGIANTNGIGASIIKIGKDGSSPQTILQLNTYAGVIGDGAVNNLISSRINVGGTNRNVLIGATRSGPGSDITAFSGTIFRCNEDGSGLTVMHTFPQWYYDSSEGVFPRWITRDQYGYIYGTTYSGGPAGYDYGTLFQMTPLGRSFRVLRDFHEPSGRNDQEILVSRDGHLFGTMNNKGAGAPVPGFYPGGVFSADDDGGYFNDEFLTFPTPPVNPNYGGNYLYWTGPLGGPIEATNGLLYGAHGFQKGEITAYAQEGIPLTNNPGYYYRVAKDGSGFTQLASVPNLQTPAPQSLVEGPDGRLYGFLIENTNQLIALHPTTGDIEVVQNFGAAQSYANPQHPHTVGGLVNASDGALYGTVLVGGTNNHGFLFRYVPPTNGVPRPEVARGGGGTKEPKSGGGSPPPSQLAMLSLTLDTNQAGRNFGRSVALSNDCLVVGVPFSNDPTYRGTVQIFRRSGTNWNLETTLAPPGGDSVRLFGFATSIESEAIVVGAPGIFDTNLFAGAAYVFIRTNGNWVQKAKLVGLNSAGDEFGTAVGLFRTNIIIGAPGESTGGAHAGGAWIFERNAAGNWLQKSHVLRPGGTTNDYFGSSVAIRNDNAVVGAPRGRGIDVPTARGTAGVVIYAPPFYPWTYYQTLQSDYSYAGDFFGASVGISSNRVMVGMPGSLPFNSNDTLRERRAVIVFNRSGFTWSEAARIRPTPPQPLEMFGASLAFDGSRVTVGAPHDPEFTAGGKGATYVYDAQGTNWASLARLQAAGNQTNDAFALSVALWSDTVVVGSVAQYNSNAMSGAVHLFDVAPPRLAIANTPNGVRLEWDPARTDFNLESAASLAPNAEWLLVTPAPTNTAHLVQPAGGAKYFRLSKPR